MSMGQKQVTMWTIQDEVMVDGLDPRPLWQYKYPKEAEPSVKETMKALQEQGVVIATVSPCNSAVWLVIKSDGVTWRLTIDYRKLN